MTEIKWEAPPTGGPHGSKYGAIAEALRERPAEWALVRPGARNTSAGTYVRKVLGPDFEVTTHSTDGGVNIYARYVGEAAS